MAKVIGFDPKLLRTCKCRNCAAIVEYSENEVKKVPEYDYGGGCEILKLVECPNCGYKIHT